jgi:hypothetical protein
MKYSLANYVFWCIWAVVILFFGTTLLFGVAYAAIGPLTGGLLVLAGLILLQYPFMRLILGKELWNGNRAKELDKSNP